VQRQCEDADLDFRLIEPVSVSRQMDGLGFGVLHGQMEDDLGKLKPDLSDVAKMKCRPPLALQHRKYWSCQDHGDIIRCFWLVCSATIRSPGVLPQLEMLPNC
jgi:hypothetical protein